MWVLKVPITIRHLKQNMKIYYFTISNVDLFKRFYAPQDRALQRKPTESV